MKTNLEYWQERAIEYGNSYTSTSNDLHLKTLEEKNIHNLLVKYTEGGQIKYRVLDVGCGNGLSTSLYSRLCVIDGIDFSSNMIDIASKYFPDIKFRVGDITKKKTLPTIKYDVIILNRCLQNILPELQSMALDNILNLCVPNGVVILCECFQDYLDNLNKWRKVYGLKDIYPHEYNYYLDSEKLKKDYNIIEQIDFAGSYYLLSRVFNAYEAKLENRECKYDDELNIRALKFPSCPGISPLQIFVLRNSK